MYRSVFAGTRVGSRSSSKLMSVSTHLTNYSILRGLTKPQLTVHVSGRFNKIASTTTTASAATKHGSVVTPDNYRREFTIEQESVNQFEFI